MEFSFCYIRKRIMLYRTSFQASVPENTIHKLAKMIQYESTIISDSKFPIRQNVALSNFIQLALGSTTFNAVRVRTTIKPKRNEKNAPYIRI